VLLCCVRFLGNWPCPRCLVHKSEIQDLGTKRDINRRETKRRVDDDRRRMLVETARDMIYVDGVRPGAKAISNLLESRVVTPTRVSTSVKLQIPVTLYLIFLCRMHFLNAFRNTDSTFIQCLLSICCTSSNLGSGRRFSPTFSDFYMLREVTVSRNLMKGISSQWFFIITTHAYLHG
jgi:hypothetical protein